MMRQLIALTMFLALAFGGFQAEAEPQPQFAQWVSDLRAKHGLGPVRNNAKLQRTAELHAQDMAKRNFFSHKGSNGSTVGKRSKKMGYRYCKISENIALGQKTAQAAMNDWIKSSGHLKNMLMRGGTEIGVARTSQNHWVMVIAGPYRSC